MKCRDVCCWPCSLSSAVGKSYLNPMAIFIQQRNQRISNGASIEDESRESGRKNEWTLSLIWPNQPQFCAVLNFRWPPVLNQAKLRNRCSNFVDGQQRESNRVLRFRDHPNSLPCAVTGTTRDPFKIKFIFVTLNKKNGWLKLFEPTWSIWISRSQWWWEKGGPTSGSL